MGLIRGFGEAISVEKRQEIRLLGHIGQATGVKRVQLSFQKSDKGRFVEIFKAYYLDTQSGKDTAEAQFNKFVSQAPATTTLRVTNADTGEVYKEASGTKPTLSEQLGKWSNQKIIISVVGSATILGVVVYLGTRKK
jgi:hypothetical protein